MDKLVFDIETKNFFDDPDVGPGNMDALKISVVGAYSYAQDAYFCFDETQFEEMKTLFRNATTLIGFSSNRYDIPVLNRYVDVDLWKKERVDLLEEVEYALGRRVSLNSLAKTNLGVGKTGHGSQAIALYKEGRIEELKAYCLQDVKLTKALYDIAQRDRQLLVFDREENKNVTVGISSLV
ncbi:MAG: ribonuclease H-like domain-containing protein [Candidatus Liptonbacteria bacterium]|nr:ribonuclease H-like domain-containing protein [Candidatus Liptonbacteria bacterium]